MAVPSPQSSTLPAPTPAMRQYQEIKARYRDAVVFFRMGDFYEMFYEDALVAARALELTLTSRAKDASGSAIPMCGVPYHAADTYLARLVRKGFRVAICEQTEDARKAKGLVRREVVRVVSPGTLTDAAHLDAREPSFLMAIVAHAPRDTRGTTVYGAALLDVSTGEFSAGEFAGDEGCQALVDEVQILAPRELFVPEGFEVTQLPLLSGINIPTTRGDGWIFEPDHATRVLAEQLGVASLAGVGLEDRPAAARAAGALVHYLRDTQKADLAHVRGIRVRGHADCLVLDATTVRHLEIVDAADGGRRSLLRELDCTVTPMAGRLLRAWLTRPLVAVERIQDRLDAVEEFAFRQTDRSKLRETLKAVHDLERLVGRAALRTAGPRDLVGLRQSLTAIPRVRLCLESFEAPLVRSLVAQLDEVPDVRDTIAGTLVDDPPPFARDGGCIRSGVDAPLDALRATSQTGKQRIADMEEAERARTGISSLKVRFNRVFGYYIEVSNANLRAVPADYQRRQTVAGGERFVTPALKEYEASVLGAEERLLEREVELFEALRASVAAEAPRIQDTAHALAALDVLAAFAEIAARHDYVKPQVHDGDELLVIDARHPVVERYSSEPFVPNDVRLNAADHQLLVLTGPNMGGKSTYLRQTALLSVMTQAGSFVPARSAKLAVVDRVFARVGASDNIARGQSTFMVEMQETAHILNSATSRSLVILDEIGRGTATFDGLSLAWAVAEYLASNPHARPKTLFATHYHELTDLAEALPGVANYHVVCREWRDGIVFLRKVAPGRSDRSYGIQVARLAGLPPAVVQRAGEILASLEQDELSRGGRPSLSGREVAGAQQQLGLFAAPAHDPVGARIAALDLDRMTPLEALQTLAELKRAVADS